MIPETGEKYSVDNCIYCGREKKEIAYSSVFVSSSQKSFRVCIECAEGMNSLSRIIIENYARWIEGIIEKEIGVDSMDQVYEILWN